MARHGVEAAQNYADLYRQRSTSGNYDMPGRCALFTYAAGRNTASVTAPGTPVAPVKAAPLRRKAKRLARRGY